MPHYVGVIRRALGVGALLFVLCTGLAHAAAPVPAGPRLAFLKLELGPPAQSLLLTSDAGGDAQQVLAGGGPRARPLPEPFGGLSWSADGGSLAFVGIVGGTKVLKPSQRRVFFVGADGSGLREVPHTEGAVGPVISPDGKTIAFARQRLRFRRNDHGGRDISYESVTTWLIGSEGESPRRLTAWKNGVDSTPSSFSPDGRALAISRDVGQDRHEAISFALDGTGSEVLIHNGLDAVYSPDGTRVAFLRGVHRTFERPGRITEALMTDVFTMAADGTDVRRLSRTPTEIETALSWDPAGQRLAFTRIEVVGKDADVLGFGDSLLEINADGTCSTEIASDPRAVLFGARWQPGLGRDAGPISC